MLLLIEQLKVMDNLEKAFYLAENFFFNSINQETYKFQENINFFVSRVNSPNFNFVAQHERPNDAKLLIETARSIYGKYNLSWVIIVDDQYCDELYMRFLKQNSFYQIDESIAMYYSFNEHESHLSIDNQAKLDIRKERYNLKNWSIPMVEAFESTPELMQQYAKIHLEAQENNKECFHHFAGFCNSMPVTSLTLTIKNNIARLDDIGTRTQYQKRGFATKIITHALSEARKLGARFCFLEASKDGFSIYKNLGFQPIFKIKIFKSNL